MKWLMGLGAIFLCVTCGLLGLAAGINLNPQSTVRFVPVIDANAWSSVGTWFGAIGTIAAVALSLHFSRRDDVEGLTIISEVTNRANLDGAGLEVTIRVVCTGRLPTTILAMGIGSDHNASIFHPIAMYTTEYDEKKHLSRGETFEATLSQVSLAGIARGFSDIGDHEISKLKILVKTGLKVHREVFGGDAAETVGLAFRNRRGLAR